MCAVAEGQRAGGAAHGPLQLGRARRRWSAPSSRRQLALLAGAWPRRRSVPAWREPAQGGDGQQAERAGAEHDDGRRAVGDARPSAPCTAQAVGSTMTAASSDMSAGTACSWLGWATIRVDQPPPVSQQKPVCRPGSRSPKAMRSQLPRSPARAGGADRGDAAGDAAEHRLEHDPVGAVDAVAVGHDLVAGHERERHDRLEVARRRAVDGGRGRCRRCPTGGAGPAPSRGRAARAGRRRAGAAGRPGRRRRARPDRPRSAAA